MGQNCKKKKKKQKDGIYKELVQNLGKKVVEL